MIQWRPCSLCFSDRSEVRREILMTCCLDGTVRLWSEDELVKSKKQRGLQISFSVIAVIEVNNTLNGVLGVDITVRWSMESGSVVSRDEEGKFELFSGDSRESQVGKCEWLVSVGPGPCVNFWAIHCLDDVFPPRYPRITSWKQSKLLGSWGESYVKSDPQKYLEQSIFVEAVMSRRLCSGPPTTCSLLHLLPDDSFVWSALSNSLVPDSGTHVSNGSANSFSCCLNKPVKQDGHKGSIRQVSVHPYCCEIELAVSMDSNRMLFFWSLSTFSTLIPTLNAPTYPLWNLLCKFDLRNISEDVQYSCLCWAPSVSHDNRFLVLGGESGADCFIVGIKKEVLSCQRIFTIPFLGERNVEVPPDSIHTIPLASKCSGCFANNSFLVVCIWRKSFQAFSWKVVLHSENQFDSGRCSCGFDESSLSITSQGRHVTCFNNETFSAVVYEASSVFPSSLEGEYPTCISVVPLNNTVLPIQHEPYRAVPGYHIATGCSDGTVKLWKMSCADNPLQTEKESHIWELVGMYGAHRGPVSMVVLSSCGRIVTVCRNLKKNSTSIHIWEAVKLIGDGSFLLEDALILQDYIVGIEGLSLGDGRFLLAVCLPNELCIYSHKHASVQNVLHNDNSKEEHLWSCIALSHSHHDIAGFLWGPKGTITLVHENHLSLFSSWLVTGADEYTTQIRACPIYVHDMLPCANNFNETAFGKFKLPENYNSGTIGSNSVLRTDQDDSHCSHSLWNLLDIADKLSGPVASYHPRALVQYLYSGEWKRVNAALQHLIQSMKASEASKVVPKCSSCRKSCHSIPELPLSEYFVATTSNNISNKDFLWGDDRSNTTFNLLSPSNSFLYVDGNLGTNTTTSVSQNSEIVELLDKNFSIYGISDTERTQILAISDLMVEITDQSRSSPYKSLDEAGRRFWVAVQFRQLHALRRSGYSSSSERLHVDSASIAWAFQSDCQDDLLNSVLPLEPTWPEMQKLGIGLWHTNVSQLRTRMEKLARLQYLKSKDPKDCALLYIALNRIKVLVGLFKISRDEKDKRLYEFLSRNFQEERHKAAALKNAYVLMGRHQWELAIAFFLLGDDFSSAVNVCAKNLQDEQLAIVICRLVEGSGGPLERNLISNILLPHAVEKGDNWLSSLLEWILGNYCQSVNRLFGCHPELGIDESKILGGSNVFSDPEVGQYCAILSTKNVFRNCVGEAVSAKLSKFSFAMASCAMNKCGLPLEALECLCTNSGIDDKESINIPAGGDHKIFDGMLNPFSVSKNWLSSSVISDIVSNLKVTMASKYLSRLLRNHLFCSQCNASLSKDKVLNDYTSRQIEELTQDVTAVISIFDRRFSLKFADIAEKILIFCCHDSLLFIAYVLLWGCKSPDVSIDRHGLECCSLRPINYLLLVSFKESCKFLSRHVVYSSFMCFVLNMELTNITACASKENRKYIMSGLSNYLNASRLLLRFDNGGKNILDNRSAMLTVMDLLEYIIEFSFSWLYCDIKALLIMINPILAASVKGESFQVLLDGLVHSMRHRSHDVPLNTEGGMSSASVHKIQLEKSENSNLSIDEKWNLIGASLWIRLTSVMQLYLREFVEKERLEHETGGSDSEFKGHFSSVAAKFAMDSIHFVSSSLVKVHASFLRKNLPTHSHSSVLFWLESSQQWSDSNGYDQLSRIFQLANNENMEALFSNLWEISVNSVDICNAFVNEGVKCFSLSSINVTRSWKDIRGTGVECKVSSTQRSGEEHKHGLSSNNNDQGQGFTDRASSNGEVFPETKRKESIVQKDFQSPRELLRRSGELLEAICLNSINEKQAAIATNRKGLVFFNWSEKKHCKNFAEYVWSGSDWPLDSWAGCESTPTPTFISSGAGLGRKKGSQPGSGGATIGLGSLAKPGRDLTGGGAFGIPGYAGIGASGFGWGEPEEFEDFVDPPATLGNIHSRALSRHPSLPLFLVGSSNTHVYLWEFGKDSAMATYGVLPAANIPPPYALASISSVQFDYYGQRFATAALDGTVCTWQVEVGGRSNVHPTDSSLCFDIHASDVSYVSASGSVIASAGSNSNGANVVIWDTLSPPGTCQTSIMCHEGGARSLSVFDSDRGCGSISPLVVTGGKSGDVALHDFRFLSTGKSQHNRISMEHGVKAPSTHDTKSGTSGGTTNGMVWHIPKAHLGSVTKVTTIPNTSLFLTGSKDGDVKLWDAKNSQLVFHWPKLHERHTFFQPTSRGFGGVVRAAVTDLQVLSHGFISCGGDGSVKLVQLKDDLATVHQQ
ncbi:hypothetical protein SEVIR_5G198200v4 [Setaria viridis]